MLWASAVLKPKFCKADNASNKIKETLAKLPWGKKYIGQRQKWFAFRFNGDETQINIDTVNTNKYSDIGVNRRLSEFERNKIQMQIEFLIKEKSWARANRKMTKCFILISNFDFRHFS